jgi:hypothetical protein
MEAFEAWECTYVASCVLRTVGVEELLSVEFPFI